MYIVICQNLAKTLADRRTDQTSDCSHFTVNGRDSYAEAQECVKNMDAHCEYRHFIVKAEGWAE